MNNDTPKYKIAILGGDKRLSAVASLFSSKGHEVALFGLSDENLNYASGKLCSTVDKAMQGADFAILPLPLTRDNLHLSAVGEKTPLSEIIRLASANNTILLGGIIPEETKRLSTVLGVEIHDYYAREELQRKNALPSAEGALMLAMENTDVTINGMTTLVCGYGRIGKILAFLLRGMGAFVTVAARRDEVICEATLDGFETVKIQGVGKELRQSAEKCDVIFNTVPAIIFSQSVVSGMASKPLYIEIASSPGGIDLGAARDHGIKTIIAPSIPGKYSSKTAGKYIFETVCDILSERGIMI